MIQSVKPLKEKEKNQREQEKDLKVIKEKEQQEAESKISLTALPSKLAKLNEIFGNASLLISIIYNKQIGSTMGKI